MSENETAKAAAVEPCEHHWIWSGMVGTTGLWAGVCSMCRAVNDRYVAEELDRLRAEVERLEGVLDGTAEHECSDIADIFGGYLCSCGQGSWLKDGCASPPEVLRRMAERVEAERDVLRARLAKVESLADDWANIPAYDTTAYDQGRVDQRRMATEELLAALASVPEPSDSEPECTCTSYVVDYSDPDRYHAENIDREDDPACPVHGDAPASGRLACNWRACRSPQTGKCFAWCKCRCHDSKNAPITTEPNRCPHVAEPGIRHEDEDCDSEPAYRPCAGCDSIADSCRAVKCPAVSSEPKPDADREAGER